MKKLLITGLLLVTAVTMPTFAQENDAPSQQPKVEVARNLDGGLKIDIGVDDDISVDEKIDKVADLISEFDSEFGRELKSELGSLSDEDKAELVEKLDQGFTFDTGMGGLGSVGTVLIGVPTVILIFGMPLFLLLALLGAGNRKRKQKMELVELYIKSDRDIPEHVMTGLDNGGSASSLKSGLTLTAVGLGIVAALGANGAEEAVGFGLIPMFLGIARLVFWFLVERKVEPSKESDL